jgi:peptidoglycan/LPS O-acetylase OafA/YrhL
MLPENGRGGMPHVGWLDRLKAVAIVWIALNHVVERIFGYPYIANPSADWPPLAERVAQLRPLAGDGLWDLPLNLLRYLGWCGDQGVQLFLIASGFGLTWVLLSRGTGVDLPAWPFVRRRAARIYPLWWAAHALFLGTWILTGFGLSPTAWETWASALGIRITPALFYYFSPAWWFIGLILQLYLVYPLLWRFLAEHGPGRLLLVVGGGALLIRGAGLLLLDGYLDIWARGGIFITRLPEFLVGMAVAAWLHRHGEAADRRLRGPAVLGLAVIGYCVGTGLSLTRLGMTVAPVLLGTSSLVLLHAALRATEPIATRGGRWVGRHSYSLYLTHHVFILLLIPEGTALRGALLGTALALAATVLVALVLERIAAGIHALASGLRAGRFSGAAIAAGIVLALVAASLGAEIAVRRFDPQEVLGWGERPALVPDPELGWKLAPSRTTHLRWVGYDYVVTSNELGFPGPLYPEARTPGTMRLLTVGDAYTSAEGVDTDEAWPRLLEGLLAGRTGRPVEVLNFGMTGYGPRQYAEVVERYAPIYRPDRVLVTFFVNDFADAALDDDEVRADIGFGRIPADSPRILLARGHLRRFLELRVAEPVESWITGEPEPDGYFLGSFAALERADDPEPPEAGAVRALLGRVRDAAAAAGAEVTLLLVPAPAQVCGPDDLRYWPTGVDLEDTDRFDVDRPQRAARAIADGLGLEAVDLRPLLRQDGCPYHPGNLHWTEEGHRRVAAAVADLLAPHPAP